MYTDLNSFIKGINVCNPVEVDKDYLLYTVEYAHNNGFNHIQINGPIHDAEKGNIDGMTPYRKYACFDALKDADYIKKSMDAINLACEKANEYGIKIYVWHHELEIPADFTKIFPEVVNDYGDVEVSHSLIQDFIENKIEDFFHFYPGVHGIVLTLHETKVPLLKLKNQKLGKVERVKYVTQILYEACKALGKELLVRPFASIEEDYEMMTKAYEEISVDLPIMDKWTQFDWSLTLPHNAFFKKIKKNPLVVETDIFGEYFGKGRLPIMLKEHLKNKFDYCKGFSPIGYVNRIDRAGQHPFGDVNEVNAVMTSAYLNGNDPEVAAINFFRNKYPEAHKEVMQLMEKTEEVQEKTFYLKGYYFTELSYFPSLNQCKNHFFFEQMRNDCKIASNEWFIPKNWIQPNIEDIINEKETAVKEAHLLYDKLCTLEEKIDKNEYHKLWVKFYNLMVVAKLWYELTLCLINYVRYFETKEEKYEKLLYENLDNLLKMRNDAVEVLGNEFYCLKGSTAEIDDRIPIFVKETRQCFELEKEITQSKQSEKNITDFVVCGGVMEGHELQKEVNFSDTLLYENSICRITGNKKGLNWSSINAHGWFSYKLKIVPDKENVIKVCASAASGRLNMKVTIGENEHIVNRISNKNKELKFTYRAKAGEDYVRIRFDKISENMPCVHTIDVIK